MWRKVPLEEAWWKQNSSSRWNEEVRPSAQMSTTIQGRKKGSRPREKDTADPQNPT
jgi:hypothetical protein